MSGTGKIYIEQYRSGARPPVKHKRILRALGLEKLHRVVEMPDNDAVRGMVKTIPHLIRIVDGPKDPQRREAAEDER